MDDNDAATLPPAQPQYVLRGHAHQIHALAFLRGNSRLLTGDAGGWVVLWNVTTKRAVAVWRAHAGPILGLSEWGPERIITHGRDTTLKVWQIRNNDEDGSQLSTVLPVDDDVSPRKEPWLLHNLSVNTLTFCAFSLCREVFNIFNPPEAASRTPNRVHSIYLAVPGASGSEVDVHRLPTERRLSTVRAPSAANASMLMATRILFHRDHLLLVAGYESGHVCIFDFDPGPDQGASSSHPWDQVYLCQAHSQPTLSLDVAPAAGVFFSSSADDILARHPLCVRGSDTAGLRPDIVHTRHAGQQGLRVRSDEKVLATAGWDSRVRVYSVKTMEELAVLKWHKEGCYATAFAVVDSQSAATASAPKKEQDATSSSTPAQPDVMALTTNDVAGTSLRSAAQRRREAKAQAQHWVAAGSKDGKVSLWDIY